MSAPIYLFVSRFFRANCHTRLYMLCVVYGCVWMYKFMYGMYAIRRTLHHRTHCVSPQKWCHLSAKNVVSMYELNL